MNSFFKDISNLCVRNHSAIKTLFSFSFIFLIYLIFENSILQLIADSFLGIILFPAERPSIIYDILITFCSITILILAIIKGKERYKLSPGYIYILSILLLYYISYRFFPLLRVDKQFEFIESHIFNIRYYDLLFGSYTVGCILFFLFNKYNENLKKKKQTDTKLSEIGRFIVDNPIKVDNEDRYGYINLADQIVSTILDPRETNNSFTIGINGQWGIGKSSLLNLIKNRLDEKKLKKDSDHILISFSPLLLNTSNSLTVEFLYQLNIELKKYSIQSNDQLRKYIFYLTSKINDLWSGLISIFSGDQSSQEQSKILDLIIKKVNRQIIVTIDDLDRLEKEEITEIFRLIRNIADLPNMVYIIAFDKNYLCKKLVDNNYSTAELFIEKFFTVEVVLPKIKIEHLRTFIVEESKRRIPYFIKTIEIAFNIFDSENSLQDIFDNKVLPKNYFEASLNTQRDVIRFINSLILIPQKVLLEFMPIEILILELLKLKNSIVYNALKMKSIVSVDATKNVYILDESNLDNLLISYNPPNPIQIKSAVQILFGGEFLIETKTDKKSFINLDRYDIYFNYLDNSFVYFSEMDALRKD